MAKWVDKSENVRLEGRIENGGSQPTKQENIGGGDDSVAPGSPPTSLTWAHDSGDALLDYSAADAPTVIDDGTYAVTVQATVDAAAGKQVAAYVLFPVASIGGSGVLDDLLGFAGALITVSGTVKLSAGDTLAFTLGHNASGSLNCALQGYVVKLA